MDADGVEHAFALPASSHESARVNLDLDLGEHELAVRVVDAAGAPVATRDGPARDP